VANDFPLSRGEILVATGASVFFLANEGIVAAGVSFGFRAFSFSSSDESTQKTCLVFRVMCLLAAGTGGATD